MAGALSPRQKMINMMYLILTGMLALNVSKDILNAFVVVNNSLVVTNKNFDSKVQDSYLIFANALKQNPEKVKEYYDKAMLVKKNTDELIGFIKDAKIKVIMETDKISKDEALKVVDSVIAIKAKENFDDPTRVFCGVASENCTGAIASEIKKRIEDYKKKIYEILGKDKDKIKLSLITDGVYFDANKTKINWEQNNFQHMVLVAAITNLNRIIGEIKNAEFDAVNQLFSSVSNLDFKFDQLKARVVPKSKIVTVGENYEADLFVAAWDSKQTPEIWIGDFDTVTWKPKGPVQKLETFVAGIGKFISGGGVGDHIITGVIKIPSPTPGEQPRYFPFKDEYKVIPSTSTVSNTKMNVLYVGLENPVSISVPGTASDKINASITGGSIVRKGNGNFIVTVPGTLQGKTVKINVSATTASGTTKGAGSYEFRVMGIPIPKSYLTTAKTNEPTPKNLLIKGELKARLMGFVYEGVGFNIISYTVMRSGDGKKANGNGSKFNSEVISLINSTKSGGMLFFDLIKASGPGGIQQLSPVIVTIQ